MHKEILQSPWLCELIALHINLRETKAKSRETSALFHGCSLTFKDGKPSLTCELFDSFKIETNLTCSICLVSYLFSFVGWISHFMCITPILHVFTSYTEVVYLKITAAQMQVGSNQFKGCAWKSEQNIAFFFTEHDAYLQSILPLYGLTKQF